MVIPPCSFCFLRPGRRLADRLSKGGAGGKAGRAGTGEQGSGKVRFGGRGIKFRKLDACGLQGGVQPQQGRDGGRDEIGQRLPRGDVGRAGQVRPRARGAVGKIDDSVFRLAEERPVM